MACPMCLVEFVIPEDGLSSLPRNIYIETIINIQRQARLLMSTAASVVNTPVSVDGGRRSCTSVVQPSRNYTDDWPAPSPAERGENLVGCLAQLVERWSSAGVLSLSYAWLAAEGWQYVGQPFAAGRPTRPTQPFGVDKLSSEQLYRMCAGSAIWWVLTRLRQVRIINRWEPFVACRLPLNPSVALPCVAAVSSVRLFGMSAIK